MIDQSVVDQMSMGSLDPDIIFNESSYLDVMVEEDEELDDIHISESAIDPILDFLS